jgi:hypothetical protein
VAELSGLEEGTLVLDVTENPSRWLETAPSPGGVSWSVHFPYFNSLAEELLKSEGRGEPSPRFPRAA